MSTSVPSLSALRISKPRRPHAIAAQTNLSPLLNEQEVATLCGVCVGAIRRWRLRRCGPRYLKLGVSVRYHPEDIAAWLAASGVETKGGSRMLIPDH